MTDRIVLAGMVFQARHGVADWEKVELQPFEVDVELVLDVQPAGLDYDLAKTVDYGSVYAITRSRSRVEFEERWFLMQIRVEGSKCRVWLDGELVSETDILEMLAEGHIGLQIHMDNASVEFRDLRVRNLEFQQR